MEETLYIVEEYTYQPNGGCWSDYLNIIGVFKDKDIAQEWFHETIRQIIRSDTREEDEIQPYDIRLLIAHYEIELSNGKFKRKVLTETDYSYQVPKGAGEIYNLVEPLDKTENLLGKYRIVIKSDRQDNERIYRITKNTKAALEIIRTAEEKQLEVKDYERDTFKIYNYDPKEEDEDDDIIVDLEMPIVNIRNNISVEI